MKDEELAKIQQAGFYCVSVTNKAVSQVPRGTEAF
jgi:hypothetical protein